MIVRLDWDDLRARRLTPDEWVRLAAQSWAASDLPVVPPPPGLLDAIADGPLTHDEPLLTLARAWPRAEMSQAVLAALRSEVEVGRRDRLAWLAKHVLSSAHAADAIAIIHDSAQAPSVKGWLLNGLERLALGRELSWDALEATVAYAASASDPAVRVSTPSLLAALPWRDTNVGVLARLLAVDDDVEVLTAAAHLVSLHPDIVALIDPAILERLRTHPNAWVRQSARTL